MRRRRDCELELVGYSSSPHENFLHWRMVGRDLGDFSQLGDQGYGSPNYARYVTLYSEFLMLRKCHDYAQLASLLCCITINMRTSGTAGSHFFASL